MTLDVNTTIFIYLSSYIISCVFCGLLYYYNKYDRYRSQLISFLLFLFTAIPFALLCANRNEYTGYDTWNNIVGYLNMQYGISEISMADGGFNYIFKFLRYIFYVLFGQSVQYWFFFMAIVPLLFVSFTMKKIARTGFEYAFGYLLFLLYLSPIMMDQSRQFFSISMGMLALYYLRENDKKSALVLFFFAIFLHESVLFLFAFYFFAMRKNESKLISYVSLFVVILVSTFFIPLFVSAITSFLPVKYLYIQEQAHSGTSGLAWIVDLMPLCLIMSIYYKYRKLNVKNNFPLELCALSAIPFRLAGYMSFFIMRLSYYGEAVCILLLIDVLRNLPKLHMIFLSFLVLLIFFLHWYIDFVLLGLNAAIPYSFCN